MQAIPSTYHQCIKFPHNGFEIKIKGDLDPFNYYNSLNPKIEIIIPSNCEAPPSQPYIDPKSLKESTSKSNEVEIKIQVKEQGVG